MYAKGSPRSRSTKTRCRRSGRSSRSCAPVDALQLPALLSAARVAEVFGRSERTIRDWVRAGHLRPVRIGRAVFFRADDIHALLKAE